MSGRIRSIKPELLDDAVTAGLSHVAFRLFVAAIVLADDYGNLRLEPGWVRGQVFWAQDVPLADVAAALDELGPLILGYEVNGQRYGSIRNWSKHQKVSHPGKPRVPGPRETLAKLSGDPPESLVPDLRSPIPITDPDQGSWTGERTDPPPPSESPVIGTPTEIPIWFSAAIETVETQTGETLRPPDSWLRYSGHRAGKGVSMGQQDAVYWLTTVMVPESRKERRAESDKRERDAKWDRDRQRQRAGPEPPPKPTAAQSKAFAEQLVSRVRKAAAT